MNCPYCDGPIRRPGEQENCPRCKAALKEPAAANALSIFAGILTIGSPLAAIAVVAKSETNPLEPAMWPTALVILVSGLMSAALLFGFSASVRFLGSIDSYLRVANYREKAKAAPLDQPTLNESPH